MPAAAAALQDAGAAARRLAPPLPLLRRHRASRVATAAAVEGQHGDARAAERWPNTAAERGRGRGRGRSGGDDRRTDDGLEGRQQRYQDQRWRPMHQQRQRQQQQRWRPPGSEPEAAAEAAPPPPPEFWELSNGGVTPHPLFLEHLEGCVRRGSWRAIQIVMSRGSEDGAVREAHARVALAATARALRVAAATALREPAGKRLEEDSSGADNQQHQQQRRRQRQQQQQQPIWVRPWWDRRATVRPISVLFPAAEEGSEEGGEQGSGEDSENAAKLAWAAHEAAAVFLFMRHFARLAAQQGDEPDLVAAAGVLNAFSNAGFFTTPYENPLGPSRRQLWWVLDSILDASLRGLRAGADARSARLVLSAQLAGARVGVSWMSNTTAGRSGPGTAVGACMEALGARGAMALLCAWRARNGTVTRDNAAALYRALEREDAAASARAACPMRAVREVALLANLPLQPPPPTYLTALLGALTAPAGAAALQGVAEAVPPPAGAQPVVLSLGTSAQVELLGALAAQHGWGGAAVRLEDWTRVVTALLQGLLADKALRAADLERVLFALKRLCYVYAYSLPLALSELALECVQRAAPSLSLHHVATACSTLLSLGLKPSEQTLGAVVRSVNARLGELPQSRSWDGKVIASLANGLTALGYNRVWLEGAGAVDLFPDLFTRGVACLQSGTLPPHYVGAWLRGLRRLRPEKGISPPQTLLLLNAIASSLSAAVAGRSSARKGEGGAGGGDPEEGGAGGGDMVGDEVEAAQEGGAADGGRSRQRQPRQSPPWAPRELVDMLYAVNALGLNSSGVTVFWRAVREAVSMSLPEFQPDQLAGVVVCMGGAGHHGNASALDTLLLPALEPSFRALVERARQRAAAEAADARPVQQRQRRQQQQPQQGEQQQQQQQQQEQRQEEQRHPSQQQQQVLSADLLARLPSALSSLGLKPRPQWWRLYQAALVASLPDLPLSRLAAALGAAAELALPAPAPWTRVLMRAMPEKRVAGLEPRHQATLLAALGHLADGADGDASAFDDTSVQALWGRVRRLFAAGGSEEEEQWLAEAGGGDDGQQLQQQQQQQEQQQQQQQEQQQQDSGGTRSTSSELRDSDDDAHTSGARGGGTGVDLAFTACELLRAGGRLQRLSPALAPPAILVAQLLEASEAALVEGSLPTPTAAFLARSVAVLGARPSAEWLERLQDTLEAGLDAARPSELAAVVTALCSLGVQPRTPLLERLLSFGPCPEFSPRLMADLHAAITVLLGDGGAPPKRARRAPRSGPGSPPPPAPWSAELDAPPEGAAPEDFDAFVDAARAHLGASDRSLEAPEPEEAGAGEAPALGPNSLWRFALGTGEDAEAGPGASAAAKRAG
ncbi:hypothetical protein Rsub_09814 [Raphidocelis subcapitata]|uniref:Uncharacterized protein n=1 Tax=Raphidocelis subcapitata TaxID=307507 RepID=A0A2V0PIA5_9CHLO|nr:hypothetical protein Rsub_09814 [Raphidocelis subcapitata]|eukprot:GBF97017.1 hypothetical protein Rsub_09814 [Raphidocelis subcapitata]